MLIWSPRAGNCEAAEDRKSKAIPQRQRKLRHCLKHFLPGGAAMLSPALGGREAPSSNALSLRQRQPGMNEALWEGATNSLSVASRD